MNKKIVILSVIILTGLLIFGWVKLSKSNTANSAVNPSSSNIQTAHVSEKDKPQVVSTKPDPLEGSVVSADETIEITFNRPLENVGEFKVRLDPGDTKFKLELSSDRKTGKIIPDPSFELGTGYTLFIGTETKFDGAGRWGEEKIFHFRTIRYRGI